MIGGGKNAVRYLILKQNFFQYLIAGVFTTSNAGYNWSLFETEAILGHRLSDYVSSLYSMHAKVNLKLVGSILAVGVWHSKILRKTFSYTPVTRLLYTNLSEAVVLMKV